MKEITILQSLAVEVELATVNLGELSTCQYYDRVNVQILVLNTGGKTTLSLDAANASTKVLL